MQTNKYHLIKTKKEKSKKEKSKKEKSKKEKMNKTKFKRKQKIRQKIIQKKAKRPSFIEKKVLIRQLRESRLPDDITRSILRHLAASVIQDASKRSNPKRALYETLDLIGHRRYQIAGKGNEHFIEHLWTNLDPIDEFTADWLFNAANILDKNDFQSKNFWWTLVEDMLKNMKEIEEDDEPLEDIPNHGLIPHAFDNYKKSEKAIINIMEKNNIDLQKNSEGKVTDSWSTILKTWQTEGETRARRNPTAPFCIYR